ncbi:MAG: transposase [Pseudomonadales bacterium]|nr:transposase [Pseudomonadales bacterium]
MVLPPNTTHPEGGTITSAKSQFPANIAVDTYGGKVHIEWDADAPVTPLGQLPFFIQFLKLGGRFDPWVKDCPLTYFSNNAPEKVDVLGSLFLSILSGHKRYSHITSLIADNVNPSLLGMNKVVSEDSARRAVKKIEEEKGVQWMQNHLHDSCKPLLRTPWILDVDTTIKPLYSHQEKAVKGYNPQKPGRPSHTYHTYMMANLRLVLDVEVKAGDQSHSSYSLPGLVSLIKGLGEDEKPEFVRGDIGWGTDTVMNELEEIDQRYLFKLKKSKNAMKLIYKHHGLGQWTHVHSGWEAKEDSLKLQGWKKERRVIIVRRKLSSSSLVAIESGSEDCKQLSFIDGPEEIKVFEYSVLVTDLDDDLVSLFQHYRDRADCENNFDELKNQWGWGGYTTKDVKSCRLMSRMIALIYNWWNLYVRLALPGQHHEAITSRPLLLTGVGRQTKHSDQKKITITSTHGKQEKLAGAYHRLVTLFNELKMIAPQLTSAQCWSRMLEQVMAQFKVKKGTADPPHLNCLT